MPQKHNILWLTFDHVTYRHYRLNKGAKPILPTFERIGQNGVTFTNCKSVHPLCLPARASMLTGVFSHKHGMLRNESGFASNYTPPFMKLKENGYKLGYFGKNHSGFEDLSKYGFEGYYPRSYGNPFHTPEYKEYLRRNKLPDPIFHHEWGLNDKFEVGDYNLSETNYFNNYTCGVFKEDYPFHEVDFLLDMSIDWMRKRADEKQPFVLRMDAWGPHQAYQIPKSFADTLIDQNDILPIPGHDIDPLGDKPKFVRQFLDEIRSRGAKMDTFEKWRPVLKRAYENYSYMDMRIGSLLDELERLGIADNTYVLFTADHGDAIATHGGMFDKCGDMAEELMDIPMVISGPGLPKGLRLDGLTTNLDVVPTIFDFAGLKPPYKTDGESLKEYALTGKARERLMCEHYGHFNNRFVQRCVYEGDWKFVKTEHAADQLYNLKEDPYEIINYAQKPEYQAKCGEMETLLALEIEKYSDSEHILEYGLNK